MYKIMTGHDCLVSHVFKTNINNTINMYAFVNLPHVEKHVD